MTQQVVDRRIAGPSETSVRRHGWGIGILRPWTRWAIMLSLTAAVGWYLFKTVSDRPVAGIVGVEELNGTQAFGSLRRGADWNLAIARSGLHQVRAIELKGMSQEPIHFAASGNPDVPIFAASMANVFGIDEDEVFGIYRGYGVLVREDGRQREIRLLEPAGLVSDGATITDASMVDRTLSILIRGRLSGRQRGMLVTYELPEFDWGHDWLDIVWLPPSSSKRLDTPFFDATFLPKSKEWASLTRDGKIEFSWGRTIRAPENTRDIWFLDENTLVAQTQTDTAIEFHTALLDVEPVEFSGPRQSLPAKRIWNLHVERSLDAKHALVLVNYFHDKKLFGYYRSHASSELSLVSLSDWTVVATATESLADWGSTVMQPYVDAAFSSDNRHLRLLRSSQQLEVVDIEQWIEQSGW